MQLTTFSILRGTCIVGFGLLIGLPAALATPPPVVHHGGLDLTAAAGGYRHTNQGYLSQPAHSNQGGGNGDPDGGGDGGGGDPGLRVTVNPGSNGGPTIDIGGDTAGLDGDLWVLDLNLDTAVATPALAPTIVPTGAFGPTSSGPVATIPEPSTMLLMTLGGLLLRRRRSS